MVEFPFEGVDAGLRLLRIGPMPEPGGRPRWLAAARLVAGPLNPNARFRTMPTASDLVSHKPSCICMRRARNARSQPQAVGTTYSIARPTVGIFTGFRFPGTGASRETEHAQLDTGMPCRYTGIETHTHGGTANGGAHPAPATGAWRAKRLRSRVLRGHHRRTGCRIERGGECVAGPIHHHDPIEAGDLRRRRQSLHPIRPGVFPRIGTAWRLQQRLLGADGESGQHGVRCRRRFPLQDRSAGRSIDRGYPLPECWRRFPSGCLR